VSSQDKPTDSDGWMRAMVRFFASFDRTGSASASAAELGLNRHTCQGWVRAAGLRSREGDLIIGADGASAIGILVERATRYVMLIHLPAGRTAEAVRDQLVATMTTLPAHLRGSLPWEQGAEMAAHRSFTVATHRHLYFCDPASPWQRGSNENTNGLLRQYFPKGTDLSLHGPADLEHVAQQLNGRPRKTLGWETPAQRLRALLQPSHRPAVLQRPLKSARAAGVLGGAAQRGERRRSQCGSSSSSSSSPGPMSRMASMPGDSTPHSMSREVSSSGLMS
jgi:hypothetical protein